MNDTETTSNPLDVRVDRLREELSIRTYNCLENEGFVTLADIVVRTDRELMRMPSFGRKSLKELQELLAQYGLTLAKSSQWQRPWAPPIPTLEERLSRIEVIMQRILDRLP